MKRRDGLLAALGCAAALGPPLALAQAPAPLPPPGPGPGPGPGPARAQPPRMGELKPLGQDRFQLGRTVIDKRAGSFSVPGRVHVLGKPLEYLATSPGGMKEYEALLELDTMGSEFNLACILIGLDRDPKQPPRQRPAGPGPQAGGPPALTGPRVALSLAWSEGGKRRLVPAAEALLNPEGGVKPESVEWVYTGSQTTERDGRFAADDTGTLIGFVPDLNSIIESATGIGIGAYGSVRGHAMLPPVGSAIELIVEAVSPKK